MILLGISHTHLSLSKRAEHAWPSTNNVIYFFRLFNWHIQAEQLPPSLGNKLNSFSLLQISDRQYLHSICVLFCKSQESQYFGLACELSASGNMYLACRIYGSHPN